MGDLQASLLFLTVVMPRQNPHITRNSGLSAAVADGNWDIGIEVSRDLLPPA
ncbi:MAG: hypothetical protein ACPHUF_00840 [Gammaproteobacteria bacterium]